MCNVSTDTVFVRDYLKFQILMRGIVTRTNTKANEVRRVLNECSFIMTIYVHITYNFYNT